jgi:hypothetical protein
MARDSTIRGVLNVKNESREGKEAASIIGQKTATNQSPKTTDGQKGAAKLWHMKHIMKDNSLPPKRKANRARASTGNSTLIGKNNIGARSRRVVDEQIPKRKHMPSTPPLSTIR